MSKVQKTLLKLLRGTSDANIRFDDVVTLLEHLEFTARINGSHHIFSKVGIEEILNLQALKDGKAKRYQIKQVRELILKYGLGSIND